jgi:hypothetical protein
MSGPRAVWNIAKQCGLGQRLAYMHCVTSLCVNPEHVYSASDKAEIGANVVRSGKRKGTAMAARRANAAKAHIANGITVTPPEVVRAIRAVGIGRGTATNIELAAKYGIWHTTVSMIRRGKSHRHLLEAA